MSKWYSGPAPAIRAQLIDWLHAIHEDPGLADADVFSVLLALRFRRFAVAADIEKIPPDHMHAVDVALVTNGAIATEVAASRRRPAQTQSRVDVVMGRLYLGVPLGQLKRIPADARARMPMLLTVAIPGDSSATLLLKPVGAQAIDALTAHDVLVKIPKPSSTLLTPARVLAELTRAVEREPTWPARPKALFHNDMIAYAVAYACDADASPCAAIAEYHLIHARKSLSGDGLIGYQGLDEVNAYPDKDVTASAKIVVPYKPGRIAKFASGFKVRSVDGPDTYTGTETYKISDLRAAGSRWAPDEEFAVGAKFWFGTPDYNKLVQKTAERFVKLRTGSYRPEPDKPSHADLLLLGCPGALAALPVEVRNQFVNTVCYGIASAVLMRTNKFDSKTVDALWRPVLAVNTGSREAPNVLTLVGRGDGTQSFRLIDGHANDGAYPPEYGPSLAAARFMWGVMGEWTSAQ